MRREALIHQSIPQDAKSETECEFGRDYRRLHPFWISRFRGAVCLALLGTGTPGAVLGQETPAKYFEKNCFNCHTIGGGSRVGPDLKNIDQVIKLKGRDWVVSFIHNPKPYLESDDYARKLLADYNKVPMTVPADMTAERAEALLALIEEQAKLGKNSQFVGVVAIPEGPFSEEKIAEGREFFLGYRRFANGGPSCVSCHAVQGVNPIGGGMLGPDLTQVFNKLKGRQALAGWLASPPGPTMLPVYKYHPLELEERIALVAFLEKAREERPAESVARLNFFLLGLGGTAGCLVLFDVLWRRRFRAVRRVLVSGEQKE